MNDLEIVSSLKNSGLIDVSIGDRYIYFKDPSCILPAFDTIFNYAWIIIVVLTVILIFGWGLLYIRSGKQINNLYNNFKTLILIFGILSVLKPIINIIYGENLFSRGCETKQISRTEIQELLKYKNAHFRTSDDITLYENFSVIDSGPIMEDGTNNSSNDTRTLLSQFAPSDIIEVRFQDKDRSTIYITKTGVKIKRSGTNSRSWKNNNPGNIRYSSIMRELGAIGQANGFLVFASEQDGLKAMVTLLRSENYVNLTLRRAIYRWAPEKDGSNRPERYTQHVSKLSGVSPNKIIRDLSDTEMQRVIRAMQKFEGWIPGTEERL